MQAKHGPLVLQTFAAPFVTEAVGALLVAMAANGWQLARQTISAVRQQSRRAILFYSCGKDSIALLDLMAPEFDEVVCVFMYFVPGLSHIEHYLSDAQNRYPNVTSLQVEHFRMGNIRSEGIYCRPDPRAKIKTLKMVDAEIRQQTGIDWTFYGMKKTDSLNRRLMLNTYKPYPLHPVTQKAYPLADLSNKDVLAYIRTKRLPPPISYGQGQSNAVGFDLGCFLWMRKHAPADLAKIYGVFPLSKRILFEYDNQAPEIRDANNSAL